MSLLQGAVALLILKRLLDGTSAVSLDLWTASIALRARWDQQLPEAMACLEDGFAAATVFYRFPAAHSKKIRTTK